MSIAILENEPLAPYTVYKIGGPARFFARVRSREDFDEAIDFSQKHIIPVRILGGGSNVLVSDGGYDGLIIKMEDRTLRIEETRVFAAAGTSYAVISKMTADAGLSGLEWAFGIPGTIGGAIYGNAGAFDGSTSQCLSSVELFDLKKNISFSRLPDDLHYSYRRSILSSCDWIVLSALFTLQSAPAGECQTRLKNFLERKQASQPIGVHCAGCAFKNVPIESVSRSFEFPVEFFSSGRIPAGYLLDRANMKNHVVGRAMISPRHANFIVNLGGATAHDVIQLIRIAKDTVHEKFGILLEEEIQYIGDVSGQ